jgi:hypothetical protein
MNQLSNQVKAPQETGKDLQWLTLTLRRQSSSKHCLTTSYKKN